LQMNIGSPIEVRVKSLLFFKEKGMAVILLEGPNAAWGLPILAKSLEVTSIAFALEGTEPARPLSHDLMARIIDVHGREMDFDSRPSDAIALALRANAPIFVSPTVVAKGAIYFDKGKWPADLEGKVKLEN
jgi:bifunctional DNase/RNase